MNILIAVDFSPVTEVMIEASAALVRAPVGEEPHFYVIHAAEPDPAFVGWDAGPDVARDQMAREFHREHQELAAISQRLRDLGAKRVTPLLIQGPTVETILGQGTKLDASLLIVGSHGRGKTYDVVVGSISTEVIRRSKIPVLVVPSPGRG